VKHIHIECVDFNDVRNKHFVDSSIKDLCDNVEAQNIIDFIKETMIFISNFSVFILMFLFTLYSRLIALILLSEVLPFISDFHI